MDINKLFIEKMLYPAMEKLKGNKIRLYVSDLVKTQSFSADELKKLQKDRLAELLYYCHDNVPAYRGLDPALIEKDPYEALTSLPLLSKDEFNSDPEKYLSSAFPKDQRIPNLTGGSTGVPTHFFMSRGQVEQYEAARWRGLSWYGISFGSRSVMVWGSHIELDKAAQASYSRKEKLLKNRMVIPAFDITSSNAKKYVDFLNAYKPEYIYGYASSLAAFAKIIEAYGKEKLKLKLKAVISTSETLTEEYAGIIKRVFECPVGNEYGARDAGILAYSCPMGHLHVSYENAVIEVLDPITKTPVKPGQSGVLAVTDLGSRAQPRLRWLLGDMGTLSPESCGCGISLPVFSSLDGREDSMLVGANGRLIHGHMPNQIIRDYTQIRQFRFVQKTPDTALLMLECDPDPALAEEIIAKINAVEPSWKISYEFTDNIPLPSSGKLRASVREFPLSEN